MAVRPVVFSLVSILFILLGYLLVVAQDLFMPMAISVAVWYLLVSLADGVRKLTGLGRRFPLWVAYLVVAALFALLVGQVMDMLQHNISRLIATAPEYQARIASLIKATFEYFGEDTPPDFSEALDRFSFIALTSYMGGFITSLVENAVVIALYVAFLLLEHHSFDQKLSALVSDAKQLKRARQIIQTISEQIRVYVRVKTLISASTAVVCYLIMISVGLDFAEFWAFLIFLLNYIPTLGSIAATIVPCLLALVQFETWAPILWTVIGLTSVQMSVGNILEPRLMGSTFNISGLVIIISLGIWGKMWGVVGMFLCVPIMVIANIILSHFPATRPIAILLSSDGQVRSPTTQDD